MNLPGGHIGRAEMNDRPLKELAELTRVQLAEVLRRHAWFLESRPGGRRAVLLDCDFANMALAGQNLSHMILTGSSFYGNNLSGCRFDGANAFCCDFRQANLGDASMIRTDLRGARFGGASMIHANLLDADLRKGVQITRDGKGDFHGYGSNDKAVGSGADFADANLTNATLSGVMGSKTDFSNSLMRGSRLVRAHIQGANFSGCDLESADFSQADARDVCFRGAVLSKANFHLANTAGADMADTLTDQSPGRLLAELDASLEELLARHRRFVESHGAAGAQLDLAGFDLRGSGPWVAACLTMAKVPGAVFYKLDLSRAQMQAAGCRGGDFRSSRLDGADMRGICLAGSRMAYASMRGADLRTLQIDHGRQMPVDLTNATLRHADLRGARLGGARLAGADLSYADLRDADLTGADVAGAKLVACKLSRQQTDAARRAGAIVSL
jgi:uncharacterized protein YjbI with pentapeptide repeats